LVSKKQLWDGFLVLALSYSISEPSLGLYEEPERPQNAIGYIKQYMGAPNNVDVEGLKRENEELKRQIEKLRKQAGDRAS
jgi:predicted ATP-grasp superfamily ATP-dependent carboligase